MRVIVLHEVLVVVSVVTVLVPRVMTVVIRVTKKSVTVSVERNTVVRREVTPSVTV